MADTTNRIVTEIVVDARGVEANTALFERAMRGAEAAAQSSFRRIVEQSQKVKQAQDQQVAVMTVATESTRKLAQQWDRLKASTDPALASQNAAYVQMVQGIKLADNAVKGKIATDQEAAQVIRQLEGRYEAVAKAARIAADQQEFANAQAVRARADQWAGVRTDFNTEERAKDIEAYGRALDETRARLDPLFAAEQRHRQSQDEVTKAYKAGAFGATESVEAQIVLTRLMKDSEVRLHQTKMALGGTGQAARLTAGEFTMLSYQINDVLTGLALGQPLYILASQQVGQIYQSLRNTRAGAESMGAALKAALGSMIGFFTPAILTIGGLALAIGTVVAATLKWQSAQREVARTLAGIGGASGASVGDINRIAASNVFGLSISEATELATALVATGKIGVESIGPIVAIGRNLAITFGVEAKDAADLLAKSFASPTKGAEELNAKLGHINARDIELIRSLEARGQKQQAALVLASKTGDALARAAELTSMLSQAWNDLINNISDAFLRLGQYVDRLLGGGDVQEKINDLTITLLKLQETQLRQGRVGIVDPTVTADIDHIIKKLDELRAKQQQLSEASTVKSFNVRVNDIQSTIDAYSREEKEIENLRETLEKLAVLYTDPRFNEATADSDRARIAWERLNDAVKNAQTSIQRTIAHQELETKAIGARSAAQKQAIAEDQMRLQLGGELGERFVEDAKNNAVTLAGIHARKQAEHEVSEAQRERLLSTQQNLEMSRLETTLIGKTIEEQTRQRLNLQTLHQLKQEAARRGEKTDEAELARLKAINAEIAKDARSHALKNIQTDTQFKIDTAFLSPEDVEIARQLVPIYGDVATALNSAAAAQMRFANGLQSVADGAKDFAKTFASGILDGKSAVESLTSALDNLAKKLLDSGINDLISGALYGNIAQAAIGVAKVAGAFLIDMFSDQTKAQQEAKKKLQEAQKQWGEMQDQFRDFISAMNGEEVGSLTSALRAAEKQMRDFVEAAIKAKDFEAARQAQEAFQKFRDDQINEFKATWEAMLQAFDLGLGLDSPFITASQRIRDLAKQLKGFIDDTKTAFTIVLPRGQGVNSGGITMISGGPSPDEIAKATAAVREYLIGLVEGATELSDVQKKLLEIGGTAQALSAMYTDALDVIAEGVTKAIAKLRTTFETDLQREINDVSGLGYLNEVSDLIAKRNTRLADAQLIGADKSLVNEAFTKSVQKVIDDAGLVGDAFNNLLGIFPDLAGSVHESTKALQEQIDEQKRFQQTIMEFIAQMRGGELSTLSPDKKFAEAQRNYERQIALAQSGDEAAKASITSFSQTYLEQARSFLGPSQAYGAIFDRVAAQLMTLVDGLSRTMGGGVGMSAAGFEQFSQMAMGGIVGRLAAGGMVGNGMWGMDSVRARYAGGGDIMLAGGEHVTRTSSVTPQTAPILDFINRTGSAPANDNRELIAEIRSLKRDLTTALAWIAQVGRAGNEGITQNVRETQNLRTDIRQSVGEAKIRAGGK